MHKPRFAGLAAVDLFGTAAAAYFLGRRWGGWAVLLVFVILMVLAAGLHRYFCVNTALNVALFGPV